MRESELSFPQKIATMISSGRSRRSDLAPRGVETKLLRAEGASETMSIAQITVGVASFVAEREHQAAHQSGVGPAKRRDGPFVLFLNSLESSGESRDDRQSSRG